jgi:hypothetical protein
VNQLSASREPLLSLGMSSEIAHRPIKTVMTRDTETNVIGHIVVEFTTKKPTNQRAEDDKSAHRGTFPASVARAYASAAPDRASTGSGSGARVQQPHLEQRAAPGAASDHVPGALQPGRWHGGGHVVAAGDGDGHGDHAPIGHSECVLARIGEPLSVGGPGIRGDAAMRCVTAPSSPPAPRRDRGRTCSELEPLGESDMQGILTAPSSPPAPRRDRGRRGLARPFRASQARP